MGTPAVLARRGRYWEGVFLLYPTGRNGESRYRHAAFMAFFYDTYALVGTSGSRRSASRPHSYRAWPRTAAPEGTPSCSIPFAYMRCDHRGATLLGSGNHDAPKRSSVPLPFAGLRCLPPGRGGPLAPASSAPASAPSRERSAHRTRIEAGPQGPSANGASLLLRPHPSVPCASCGCGKSFF